MPRQITIVNTNLDLPELNQLILKHFEENGYEYKKYRGELTLSREDRFGRRFFQVFYKPGEIKLVSWLKNGKNELALDDKLFGARAKRGLHRDVDNFMLLFKDSECSTYSSDTKEDSLDNHDYQLQTYTLKSDFKQFSYLSFVCGLCCLLLPLPLIVIIIGSIGGIFYGFKGINSSAKWASFIGIAASILAIIFLSITIAGRYFT